MTISSSNEYSHLKWISGDIPRDRPGVYFVWLDGKNLGSHFEIARVKQVSNGFMVMLGGYFEWDLPEKILWHCSTEGLEPNDE